MLTYVSEALQLYQSIMIMLVIMASLCQNNATFFDYVIF